MGGKFKQKKNVSKKNEPISRRDLRKKQRKEKKVKKNEYYKNKKKTALIKKTAQEVMKGTINETLIKSHPPLKQKEKLNNTKNMPKATPKGPSFLEEQNKSYKKDQREKKILEKGMVKMRKKMLLDANKFEDREIKRLEKQLKLNKRKSKSIPKSFTDEGLDYLLEICEADKFKDVAAAEMNLHESGSEFEDDLALITGTSKRKLTEKDGPHDNNKKGKETKSKSKEQEADDIDSEMEFSAHSADESEENLSHHSEADIGESTDEDDFDNELTSENENGDAIRNSEEEEDSDSEDFDKEAEHEMNSAESDEGSFGEESSEDGMEKKKSVADKYHSDGTWEDIYGRVRDKKGNIIQVQEKGKYIPPQLRAQQMAQSKKNSEEFERLKKQLKGLVNRLAESNMHSISSQIDELYMRNSRNDMNDCLLSLICEALISRVLTQERLVMEHAMLIAILHANVGMEVGAHFLQHFVQKYDALFKEGQEVENKELDNILLIIAHLYNFKVFHAVLMYNILDQLVERFTEKEVELILLVLRSVGFRLRKDDPLALKALVLQLQKKAVESTHLKDNPRLKFMLDVLLAVKNNNMSKIPQYDPSHSEHLKKLVKSMVHKGKYITEMKITLEDLLKAEEQGRWWIVGSAWSGAPSASASTSAQAPPADSQFSQPVLELARKQRMNTDTRRNIFCILMTAEDYLDAFEKLLRLGLKAQQEQEIIHVMIHCLMQEKRFNMYYAHLATHFCQADRKHQMTIQYHMWDKFKELSNLSSSQIANLARFLAHLFLEKALPISVLKVMQFSEMDKPCVRLLRQTLLSVLLSEVEETCLSVFSRVARPPRLHMFRESLRLFIHHFVLRNAASNRLPPDQAAKLKERVRLAETALTCEDVSRKYL